MYFVLTKCAFLLFMFIKSGESTVKCYLCSTKDNETMCKNPETYNLPLRKCDSDALDNTKHFAHRIDPSYEKIFEVDSSDISKNLDLDCLKVVTKTGNKEHIIRGCQLAEQSSLDICARMKKADNSFLKKVHCSRCNKDGCNTASARYKTNLFLMSTTIFVSVAYATLKF
ncbi:uncharacterized protein LOC115881068 [Sitophilus oryzae]|uniref:Uncharacterized protein LOC115881068 n=1 Tax=Sitophilus oryzae TaxID=7048 RepID=A0A6J2XS09_SITOR|nr:uncharacterized protein LOC115881068 [Sitophilus oryzae]